MEKSLSSGQAGLILALFSIALKLSVLPAMLNDFAANNSYISCGVALIFDFILVFIVITIMKKVPNKTFYELIKDTFSKPIAIILNAILVLYFIIKCLIALLELHDYYIASLFEELNPIFFIIVYLILLVWLCGKSFRNLGRTLQIIFWPMAIGLLFTLIYPISDIQITNLLPLFTNGIYPIFNGAFRTIFAFDDYIILLMIMGHINFTKKTKRTLIIFIMSSLAFVFNFYIVFVGTFGSTAVNQTLALNELPLHNPYPTTLGRLEWLTIIIWTSILLLQSAILGKCSCRCFDNIFGTYGKRTAPYVISGIVALGVIISYLQLYDIIKLVTSIPFAIFLITFHLTLILLLIIATISESKKNKYTKKGIVNDKKYKTIMAK